MNRERTNTRLPSRIQSGEGSPPGPQGAIVAPQKSHFRFSKQLGKQADATD
jgi:hypothetical protein